MKFPRFWKQSIAPPKMCDIYITDKCNLMCKMCNIGINNRGGVNKQIGRSFSAQTTDSISCNDIQKLIGEIARWSPGITVFVSGGEPLLFKDKLFCILEECSRHGIPTGMNSNGMLLTEETAEKLVSLGLKGITLSVDGLRDVHDDIRGVSGSYDNVRNAVKYMQLARADRGAEYPLIMSLLAISPSNYHSLLETITSMESWDLDAITFSHYVFTSESQKIEQNKRYSRSLFEVNDTVGGFYSITPELVNSIDFTLFADQVRQVNSFVSKSNIRGFKFNPNLSTINELQDYYINDLIPMNCFFHKNCIWFSERIDIDCDGEVLLGYPCFKFRLGNIRNKDIRKLWNSPLACDIRDFVRSHPNMPACLRCCGNRIKH